MKTGNTTLGGQPKDFPETTWGLVTLGLLVLTVDSVLIGRRPLAVR